MTWSPRGKRKFVYGVGWHAFVNWPQPAGAAPHPVPLHDLVGRPVDNDLVDGQEVEILAWRPGAREGVTYQIRRLADGREWWIVSQYLRRTRERQVAAEVVG